MLTFKEIFEMMKKTGMFDFFFPWLLFTALFYGILQSRKIISDQSSINGTIALSLSFLISYFGRGIFLANFFWIFSIFLLVFFLGGILMAMIGGNEITEIFKKKWMSYIVIALSFISLISALIITQNYGYFGLDRLILYGLDEIISLLVIIGSFVIIIYLLIKT